MQLCVLCIASGGGKRISLQLYELGSVQQPLCKKIHSTSERQWIDFIFLLPAASQLNLEDHPQVVRRRELASLAVAPHKLHHGAVCILS